MGDRFRLNPDRLDALANEVRAATLNDFGPARTGLERVAHALEATWMAETQRRFQALFGSWISQLEGLGADLVRVETYLRACAAEYRRLDADRAGASADLPNRSAPGPAAADTTVHVVQAGDSLWAIARHYGVTVDALRRANGLRGDLIVPGQVLRLPVDAVALDSGHGQDPADPTYVTIEIQPGDTLSAIAVRHGVTVEALMQANGLRDSRIYAGQGLRIPRPDLLAPGAEPPDLAWTPQASSALSAEQIERSEAAVDQLRRAPLDFIPAYLDPGLRGETFAALDDYVRYGEVGQGVGVGTLIWQAVGAHHGDVMANVLQQAHALVEREPGAIMAASGAGDALVLSGPGVVDLHRAWVLALPEPIDLDLAASDVALTVHGNTLTFTLSTARGPSTLVLHITDDGVPEVIESGVPGQHDSR